jgi:hypothetical protein
MEIKMEYTKTMEFKANIWDIFCRFSWLPNRLRGWLIRHDYTGAMFLLASLCPYHLCKTDGGLNGWETRRVCPKCGLENYWDMG